MTNNVKLKEHLHLHKRVIDNGDATTQEITSEKSKVEQAMQALTNAKSNLRADKNELQTAYNKLMRTYLPMVKPASIRQYETAKSQNTKSN